MSEKAKQILREKIDRLQEARAITADAGKSFQYDLQIEQAQGELASLEAATAVAAGLFPPGGLASPATPTVVEANPAAERLFVGREAELAQMRAALLGPVARPVALVGMAGLGKSYLADRFALCHQSEFPGGAFRVVLDPENPPASVSPLLAELADRLKVPAEPAADLAERLRDRLLAPRSLLHVENADGREAGNVAAELVRHLAGCPVIVSARLQSLGTAPGGGWERVELRWFSETEALEQLQEELGEEGERVPAANRERLVQELSFLPLAVHLAAGHLLTGQTVAGFLAELRAVGFDLEAADPADPMVAARQGRELLASTLRASVRLLRRQLGPPQAHLQAHLVEGLGMLGFAPASGFGKSLGAALAGLGSDHFEALVGKAARLSLLAPVVSKERRGRAWRLHPLLAEVLRAEAGEEGRRLAHVRTTKWFVARLPKAQQGPAWQEIGEETEALVAWLAAVPAEDRVRVERAGSWYAMHNGPFHAWRSFCEEALSGSPADADRSNFLWTLGQVAWRAGALDQALSAASDKEKVDRARGEEREAARAAGLRADVLEARGELEEALRIRREEELPVYERLGDVHSRAVTLGKIADVLQARGELEEALRIRREEELPVYERLGDVRERALTLGRIADVLQAHGELEEALRIRREEELPVYEQLGDVRERALTLGRIADVFQAHGELEEALRIRREEELPVYERLGDVHSRAVTLGKIADVLQARGELEEALLIRREEELPVYERLGDVRSRAVTLVKIADVLQARGELEEALRIFREELLPFFERLGAMRERAVTLGRIADVLQDRGELEDALRIRQEEELPVYERLGDVRERALALGKIADVLAMQGELEQAIEMYRGQVLPVDEQLQHRSDLVFDQTAIALLLLRRNAPGDHEEATRLLHLALTAAEEMRIPKAERIRRILHEHNLDVPPPPSLPGQAAE